MLWLVTFAAVAVDPIPYLPPKPVSGCSNQCVGGYASTPYDNEGFLKFLNQFAEGNPEGEQMSQYHCTAPGLSQIINMDDCKAAAAAVGIVIPNNQFLVHPNFAPFCLTRFLVDGSLQLVTNDGTFINLLGQSFTYDGGDSVLCHCRSCDEPSTSLQSPWWTVLGIALGVCFAGGAVAAARE